MDGGTVFTRDPVTDRVRWHEKPPADMKPDPDYVPEVGEWFWILGRYENRNRYCRQEHDELTDEKGKTTEVGWLPSDKGRCLPATSPA